MTQRNSRARVRPPLLGVGAGRFRFWNEHTPRPLRVWYYRPESLTTASPIVFVMHGKHRDADQYRNAWTAIAAERQFLLLCPAFAKADYSNAAYQQGNVVDEAGRPLPPSSWSLSTIEHLFDFVRAMTGNTSLHYDIYGHSAGGQFVHRLALLLPDARYRIAIAANAGWYTLPTFSGDHYPYGLRVSGSTQEQLNRAFERRLVVLLGQQDIDADDANLRQSAEARAQGANRFERGHCFYATAQAEAARAGSPFNWTLQIVPTVAHSNEQMMWSAADVLFRRKETDPRPGCPLGQGGVKIPRSDETTPPLGAGG